MKKSKNSYFGMSYREAFLTIERNKKGDMIDLMNKELNEQSSTSASLTVENNDESNNELIVKNIRKSSLRKCRKTHDKIPSNIGEQNNIIDLTLSDENEDLELNSDVSSNEPISKNIRKRPLRKHRKSSNIEEQNNIIDLTLSDENEDIELPKNNLIDLSKEAKLKSTMEMLSEDDSFNLDDIDEYKIIVLWKSYEKKIFMIRKYQKLKTIFEFYAQREDIKPEQLFFYTLNNRPITPEDSPNSLNLSFIEHIEGGISYEPVKTVNTNFVKKNAEKNENILELKLLVKNQKRPILVSMKKTEKMKCIMLQGAEELNQSLINLKFYFDGEMINPGDTPEDLELEGGEIIEVQFNS